MKTEFRKKDIIIYAETLKDKNTLHYSYCQGILPHKGIETVLTKRFCSTIFENEIDNFVKQLNNYVLAKEWFNIDEFKLKIFLATLK